jgi:hypothetical protein
LKEIPSRKNAKSPEEAQVFFSAKLKFKLKILMVLIENLGWSQEVSDKGFLCQAGTGAILPPRKWHRYVPEQGEVPLDVREGIHAPW